MAKRQALGPNADLLRWRAQEQAMRVPPASSRRTLLFNPDTSMVIAEIGRNQAGEIIKRLTEAGVKVPKCAPKNYSSTD